MDISSYIYDGAKKFTTANMKTDEMHDFKSKTEGEAYLEANKEKIKILQDKLYAERKQGLIVVLQAMDAAGKDGTVNHVFGGINPEGIEVTSFKSPSKTELYHDYLWRVHSAVPEKGKIGIFNRSHYEDVLISQVLDLPKSQPFPKRSYRGMWNNRYRQINDFEKYLYENGYTIVKIFLNVSKDVQYKRFMSRLDEPGKNWKFERSDLDTRERWDDYMKAYRNTIKATATDYAPWAVVPADRKWYARCVVSEIVLDTLKKMNPQYPKLTDEEIAQLSEDRVRLENSNEKMAK